MEKLFLVLKVCGIADLRQYLAAIGESLQGISLFVVLADSKVEINGDIPDGVVVLDSQSEGREWSIILMGDTCRFERPPIATEIDYLYSPGCITVLKSIGRLNSGKTSGVYVDNVLPGLVGSISLALAKLGSQSKQP